MKSKIFVFIVFFLLFACNKKSTADADGWTAISENVKFLEEKQNFTLQSGASTYRIPVSELPYKRVVILNASLVGYFTELGLEERIVGISSPEYIYSTKIHKLIRQGEIIPVGNEQKYEVEKIISLKPDAIFTNYVASFSNTYELLKKNGIEVIFLDEYLEQDPLTRSKYLLVIGKLMGHEKHAAERFSEIKNAYDSLAAFAKKSDQKPVVLANEMYGNQWFLPGGKTTVAKFIKDANAHYLNAASSSTKAEPLSFEEVYAKSQNAQVWVNAGNHKSRQDLLQANSNYSKMNVFNNGTIYTVTQKERASANDYFESGVVRADLVLQDYIRIFHPHLLPDYNLTYLKELK